jgi:cell division septation protein DedD
VNVFSQEKRKMPGDEDKSGSDNSPSGEDLEIFETLFREELDALNLDKGEEALLRSGGNESNDSRERSGSLEKSGKRARRLWIVFSALLLAALGAFSIRYFGIIDLGRFHPFPGQTQKTVTQTRVAKRSPIEVEREPTRLAEKSPLKSETAVSPHDATSPKSGPATNGLPARALSENGHGHIKKKSRPQSTSPAWKPSRSAATLYPYSVYLGSYRTTEGLQEAVSSYRKRGLSPYWVKIDLGQKGIWFRVFTGFFETREKADAFIRKNQIRDAATKHTRYTVLVGTYKSEKEVNTKKMELRAVGYCPYDVKEMNGACRVYTGAFYQMARAEKHVADLASKGIPAEVVER